MRIIFLIMILSVNNSNLHAQSKHSTQVIVTCDIETSVDKSFNYIVPVDLAHIFKGYKNLPAVSSTSNEDTWDTPGMERTVYFEDGHTAKEYLLRVDPNSSFSYKIDSFTSSLKWLASSIEGTWIFTEPESGKTNIVWSYTIIPKNELAKVIIQLFVKKNVRGLLNQALQILKEDLEIQTVSSNV